MQKPGLSANPSSLSALCHPLAARLMTLTSGTTVKSGLPRLDHLLEPEPQPGLVSMARLSP